MHRLGTPPAPSRTGWPVAPPHWPPRTANPRPGRCTRTVPQASRTGVVWAITLDRLRPTDIEALVLKCEDRGLPVHRCARCTRCCGWHWTGWSATGWWQKCGGCREAAGCGAQGGQTHRQRGRDRAAERCRRVAMLRTRRKQQAAERLHAGDQWTDCGLVFATEFGTPVEPRNLLRLPATSTAIRPTMLHARRSTE